MDRDAMWNHSVQFLQKKYGKGTLETLSEVAEREGKKGICTSTGSFQLDQHLGGGYPRGKFVEIFGPPGAGKTTMALQAIADCQSKGGRCLYIDAERKLDKRYAETLGVDPEALFVHQPDYAEQALDVLESSLRSSAVDFVVLDSVAALCTKAAIEAEMEDSFSSSLAKLISQALPKLVAPLSYSQATVLLLNQIRMKVGVMFGNPEKTTGGECHPVLFGSSSRPSHRRHGQERWCYRRSKASNQAPQECGQRFDAGSRDRSYLWARAGQSRRAPRPRCRETSRDRARRMVPQERSLVLLWRRTYRTGSPHRSGLALPTSGNHGEARTNPS
ncbi:MAG: hypothetical protein EP343_00550 [Deltaproteobacteria bacterium]|nr:MAG: hypothetical protein EP343_00550 [Deltaproteobacteria bacterium]